MKPLLLSLLALLLCMPPWAQGGRRTIPGPEELLQEAERLIEAGRLAEARKELLAAHALLGPDHPERVRYHSRLGSVHLATGYTLTAKDSFLKALVLARTLRMRTPVVADAYVGFGLCLIKEDNWPDAVKAFRRALRAHPSPRARQLAQTYLSLPQAKGL